MKKIKIYSSYGNAYSVESALHNSNWNLTEGIN